MVDQLLASRDEFSVYVNLSRRYQSGESSLNEQPAGPSDDFKRQGLGWVMGLARVERAAILAGFTTVSMPLPLEHVRPEEKAALAELLLDGVRSHYWAMHQDPRTAILMQGKADSRQAFVMGRRAVMLKTFLASLAELGVEQFTPVQRAELSNWSQSLDSVHDYSVRTVAMLYRKAKQANGPDRALVDLKGCPALKSGIMASLSRGNATITPIE